MPITVVAAEPIEGKVRREVAIVSSLGQHAVGSLQHQEARLAQAERHQLQEVLVVVRDEDLQGRASRGRVTVKRVRPSGVRPDATLPW